MALDTVRAETRARMIEAAERWERIVIVKQREGGAELTDARFCLHMIRSAIDVLRSRAHRKYVTDEWLQDVARRHPASEIARMIEPLVPGGYPEPPTGRTFSKAERYRIISGQLTVPKAIYDQAIAIEAAESTPDDAPDFGS
jgi:hypothetical protein